tara:strand:+ start:8583 stop:8957 length:375 start_codon:yes stop_codon:yes gene_type:complete
MSDSASGVFNNSNSVVDLASYKKQKDPLPVTFHRTELDRILQVYSRHVGSGVWRDYAIDHFKDRAVFSVYKRASEVPIFTIEKDPKRARKQGAFSVINASGLVLKRGAKLPQVLKVFDKIKVVK